VLSQTSVGDQAEIGLYVKNTTTLCEYATRCNFQASFIPKLQKWLEKDRYTIVENGSNIELCVQIFNFKLERIQRDDLEVLKDEFQTLKNQSIAIDQEMKIFTY
jgi:hypothetical protein